MEIIFLFSPAKMLNLILKSTLLISLYISQASSYITYIEPRVPLNVSAFYLLLNSLLS